MEPWRAVDSRNGVVEAQNRIVEGVYTVKKRLAVFPDVTFYQTLPGRKLETYFRPGKVSK
jgi:hypothetical protein